MGCRALPTPPPGWRQNRETGGRNRGPRTPGPGLRRRKRMLRRRGPEGGAGPHGPRRDPAGAQAALCPPPPGSRGASAASSVAPCHRPIPCLLYPHLLPCSRCAARPPGSRPRSAGPPDSPRPPAPGFPGRRLGKVEEEAAQERRRPPRDSRRHIPPQPPDQ